MKKIIFLLTCLFAMSTYQSADAQALRLYKGGNIVQTITAAEFDSIVSVGYLETAVEFVDLGLSVKWASCNLGAKSPEDYGDYYAWGETSPKDSYTRENSLTSNVEIHDIKGDPNYDAAAATNGKGVRMPTRDETEEMIENTKMTFTELNGVKGHLFVSKINGNSIFLPAAGYRVDTTTENEGKTSYFWTCTIDSRGLNSYNVDFFGEYHNFHTFLRLNGMPLRPIQEK